MLFWLNVLSKTRTLLFRPPRAFPIQHIERAYTFSELPSECFTYTLNCHGHLTLTH